jgi:hypothetical protein
MTQTRRPKRIMVKKRGPLALAAPRAERHDADKVP